MAAGNLMTGGYASIAKSGAEEIKNGNYITGAFNFASPLMAPSFISAPVKMAKGLIGATIADKVSNDVWQRTFGKGNTLAQDISNATGLSESDSHFFNPATWWGFKMGMNTHSWKPNGNLGMNGETSYVKSDVTTNLLRWLGKDIYNKPINNLPKTKKYATINQQKMIDLWEKAGVDLSKLTLDDVQKALSLRESEI